MGSETEVHIGDVWDAISIEKHPDLVPGVLHLWQRRLHASTAEVNTYYRLLSSEEQARARRFRVERAHNDFVLTRGTLRCLLGQYLERSPEEVRFVYAEHGKPSLERNSTICFNVSHTEGLALMAFIMRRTIGVDVENTKRKTETIRLAERFFSQRERDALMGLSGEELQGAFFRCWTRKEAYIKAKGDGLALPLHQFDVSIAANEHDALLATRPDPAEVERWTICDVPLGPGYAAAVAVAKYEGSN